jgi:thioredoxin-related protein
MKKIALSLIAVFSLLGASAAELEWLTNLAQAKSQAKTENKLVLMDFTGSDWCPPCKKLKKDVFSSEEFATFAKANLVLVEVDFPRAKKQSAELKKANEALSTKFDVEAYPTVVVLSSDGKQLSKDTGYDGSSAKDFVAKLEKLRKK